MKNKEKQNLIRFAIASLVFLLLGSCATSQEPRKLQPTTGTLPENAEPATATPDPEQPEFTPNIDDNSASAGLSGDITVHVAPADTSPANTDTGMVTDDAMSPEAVSDVWQRIRTGLALEDYGHARVESERLWYLKHPAYIDRVVERAEPYLYYIVSEVEKRGIPSEIALLPVVESAFQPFAYSHGRAAGIWQFIPSTGELYGLKQNWWYDGRRDITASTDAALKYLQKLCDNFDGDWLLALAAYNSGAGTVNNAIKVNRRRNRPTDFWSLKLPAETSSYVPRLLAISTIIERPEDYDIELKPIPNEPVITTVDTGGQIDLALAAELAGISLEEVYRLNPGFNRWATDPAGPNQLVIPIDKKEQFTAGLAALPPQGRVRWARHRIRGGETLSHVAKKYNTTVALLREVNKLDDPMIRAGDNLIIPVAAKSLDSYSLSARQRLLAKQNTPRGSGGLKVKYVVQSGDTFWDIARKYSVNVKQLAAWNSMAPRDTLHVGQKLVIWTGATAASLTTPGLPATRQTVHYTVRHGDSLARISQRFNVDIDDLVRWNSLDRSKYLQPGQKLVLLVDVTKQAENI